MIQVQKSNLLRNYKTVNEQASAIMSVRVLIIWMKAKFEIDKLYDDKLLCFASCFSPYRTLLYDCLEFDARENVRIKNIFKGINR